MPNRTPEEWLGLFFKRTGMLVDPKTELAREIEQCAFDVRQEALLEAYDICAGHLGNSKTIRECTNDIANLIRDNEQKFKEKSLWGNDDDAK